MQLHATLQGKPFIVSKKIAIFVFNERCWEIFSATANYFYLFEHFDDISYFPSH